MKHKTIILIALMAAVFSFSGVALAQEEAELPEPGLTPTSPFYFLDRLGDWAKVNILTFNSVRKTEIKIEITEERLAELNDVSQKAPSRTDILEKLEADVEAGANEANSGAEKLDSQNRNVSGLMEKFNNFSLKRQEVLEKVIERVPEKVKEKIEKRFENIQEQIEKHREILLKQKEKGFISEEKLGSIIQKSLSRLKDQLEERKERLEEIEDEALKEKLENIIEKKTEILEGGVLAVESRDDLKDLRDKITETRKEAIKSILETRKELKMEAPTTEEALEKIHENKLDLKEEAEKIIREVGEKISKTEEELSQLKEEGVSITQNIDELLVRTKEHLKKAKAAFGESRFGEAFGQAAAALRNINNARRSVERISEGKEELPEKIDNLKEDLAQLEEKIKSFGETAPQDIEELFEAGKAELLKAENFFKEADFQEALRHFKISERIVDKLTRYLERVTEAKEEDEEFSEKSIEEKKDILEKGLEKAKKIRKIERLEEKKEARLEMPASIKSQEDKKEEIKENEDEGETEDKEASRKTNKETGSIERIDMTARQWSFEPATIKVKKGAKVILNIKSVDVKHGFSLPEFDVKADLEPGRTEKVEFVASKTGRFQFRCSVFCGAGHFGMTGTLVVE